MDPQTALNDDLTGAETGEKPRPTVVGKPASSYNEELHERFVLWRDQTGTPVVRIGSMIARSGAAVSQYLNKKYQGNLAEIEKDIANLLRREEDLEFVTKAKKFCATTVATLIWEVLQYCDKHQDMGVAVGRSGVGKTETCNEYLRANRGTIMITAGVTDKSPGHILALLMNRVGKGPGGNTNSQRLHTIIDAIKDSRRLIIIDDAHFLTWEAFEAVRKIHDCGGVGVVFVGQERLYAQMRGNDTRKYLYDQIFSRIGIWRDELPVTKKDAREIAKSLCPELGKEELDYLCKQARQAGRYRLIRKLITLATEMKKENGGVVDIALLQKANDFLKKARPEAEEL